MDFTLLTEDQTRGDETLDAIKRYGTKAAPTDLVLIIGGEASNCEEYYLEDSLEFETGYRDSGDRTSEGDVTCPYWTSSVRSRQVSCVRTNGMPDNYSSLRRDIATRPVLSASEASQISPKEVGNIEGISIVEYGEYPQTVADESTSERLERLYLSAPLHKTGKNYTFNIDNPDFGAFDEDKDDESSLYPRRMPAPVAAGIDDLGHPSHIQESFPEYEMGGKRYIRVPGCPAREESKLPTGEKIERGKPYWVEVQPIKWLKDKSGALVSMKCLFTGIQFDNRRSYDGDFSKTSMKRYLDTYFAKEMEPSKRVTSNAMFLANLRENGR